MLTLSLSVCRKQKEQIVSLRCLYVLLIVIGYSKENLKIHTGSPPLPYPPPAFPSSPLPIPSYISLPLEVEPLKSS